MQIPTGANRPPRIPDGMFMQKQRKSAPQPGVTATDKTAAVKKTQFDLQNE